MEPSGDKQQIQNIKTNQSQIVLSRKANGGIGLEVETESKSSLYELVTQAIRNGDVLQLKKKDGTVTELKLL